jgi:hypothetical protein
MFPFSFLLSFSHLSFCSNSPLHTLSRPGQREDYEIVLTRNPPNQYRELMELDTKSLSDGSTGHSAAVTTRCMYNGRFDPRESSAETDGGCYDFGCGQQIELRRRYLVERRNLN